MYNKNDYEQKHFVTADALGTNPLEMFSIEKQKSRLQITASENLTDLVKETLAEIPGWLPIAAEVLGISPNIKDYVLTPVVSMPTDLPNKNQQAFPYLQLTAWNPIYGMPAYKTWQGKSGFADHINSDPTQSKGIILSTIMRPLKNTAGDIWKVIKLVAWDRTRDVALANQILTRERTNYSMGAYASDFQCSICNASHNRGGCEHQKLGKPNFKVHSNGRLGYWNAINPVGFELSSVVTPAFVSAHNPEYINW